jgi:hypothetical protein
MKCSIKNNANYDLGDLESHIHGMYDHFHQKYAFEKPPSIFFDSDPSNESNVLGKTAYYDPQSFEVHVFVDGRHPKDLLRSIAHELIHHRQNLEGRLDVGGYNGPGYYLENDKMRDIEQEAMLDGNATLREYEDGLKLEEKEKMSLKEWKNNELNGLLLKKFGILKEEKELSKAQKKLPKALQDKIKGSKDSKEKEDLPPKQPDSLHEEELCEECGGKHSLEEEHEAMEEGGLSDRPENKQQASAGREEGGRFKRMQESIRRTLKENKSIRLKLRK